MEEKIMTLHPEEGKVGVNLNKGKYDQIKEAILQTAGVHGEITFQDLTTSIEELLVGKFDGSIPWYVTTIKLDLEARGIIERIPGASPQRLRLSEK